MNCNNKIVCPFCNSQKFVAKYEATYIYSYILDSDALGRKNEDEFLPFLFENREKKEDTQYLECSNCGSKFPCNFGPGENGIDFTILQKAVRADHVENPQFLG